MGLSSRDMPVSWLMEKALENPDFVSLAAGFTDNSTLPVEFTKQAINEILDDPSTAQKHLQYGTTRGNERLRQIVCDQVNKLDEHQSDLDSSQVVITHGSQQFLYQFSELILDPGDIVIVEDPTYFVVLGLLSSMHIRVIGVPVDERGVNVDALNSIFNDLKTQNLLHKVKYFYGVTYFQNPSGLTTPHENKKAVLDCLEQYEKMAGHRLYYLEDAAYMHLSFNNQAPSTALTFKEHCDRIVYSSTFSKPYSTGIRVGYGILPNELVNPLLFIKTHHDFGTANFLQSILVSVMDSGHFEKHLSVIQKRYKEKCDLLISGLESSFPEWVHWTRPDGGLYVWLQLPSHMDTSINSKFFQLAMENNVLYVPGSLCYCDASLAGEQGDTYRATMRLTFGGASTKAIDHGVDRLAQVCKKF